MEEECLSNSLRSVRVWNYAEVREALMKIYSEPITLAKKVKKKDVVRYLVRLDKTYETLNKVFEILNALPDPNTLSSFYAELLAISGITDYKSTYLRLRGFKKIVRKLWRYYRIRVKLALTSEEAKKDLREFIGRSLSIVRKLNKDLKKLEVAVNELRKLPCIDFTNLKVVVSGMPQVGKSTLVGRISTSKPEVSPFPFTTKNIISGHLQVDHMRVQVFDTPGILDRPISELNEIEKRALVAIKFLADVVIYLIDPRPSSYYTIEQQIDLLQMIKVMFSDKPILVAINKIDETSEDKLTEVLRLIKKVHNNEVYKISALTGVGVDALLEWIKNKSIEFYKSRHQLIT
ncbi:MAG: GTPase [Desulfurococcaceae archaeon TW002]